MEADELLLGTTSNFDGGAQVVLTCDDEVATAAAAGLEDSSRRMASDITGMSSSAASVSGIAALDDTSVNMSIE